MVKRYKVEDKQRVARSRRIHEIVEKALARGERRIVISPDIVGTIYDDPTTE